MLVLIFVDHNQQVLSQSTSSPFNGNECQMTSTKCDFWKADVQMLAGNDLH